MTHNFTESYDIVVIGAGHAGVEASLAASRMGCKVLLATINIEMLAFMPCNPSIGGSAKGIVVREVDALGGEMAKNIDKTYIQMKMLNTGKGPAVRALRAQADKELYSKEMRKTVQHQENLTLRQTIIDEILVENGKVVGVKTATHQEFAAKAVVVTTGTALRGEIIIGDLKYSSGPNHSLAAINLADNLINIINTARENALKKVNEELINMYWQVGEYLHKESQKSMFGDSYIDSIAKEIQEEFPGIKGFNRRGLYRMKQFYETYAENDVVTPLVTQISWTNHLLIMSGCKSDEEREFYIRLCIKEKYSKRQLQRQLDSGYYERYMLSKDVLLPESVKRLGENPFLDSYVMEFLDLPNEYHENDLRKALIRNMKDFILELGKDFTFIDEEYKVQVGGDDFRIDLLFFHRGLQCLVAIELKIGKFKPEYVSKLDFYLEALDRQVKKENENPSVGLLLCATKNDEVVEYAMSRTMSPMLVSEYKLQLPDKKVLQKKLQELVNIPMIEE